MICAVYKGYIYSFKRNVKEQLDVDKQFKWYIESNTGTCSRNEYYFYMMKNANVCHH